MFGSYNATGLATDFCLDRHARYDPYGYDEWHLEGGKRKSNRASKVIWEQVDWGFLQGDCLLRNQYRYQPLEFLNRTTTLWMPREEDVQDVDSTIVLPEDESQERKSYRLWRSGQKYKSRTAIVLRAEEGIEWTIDSMQYVRSLIVELSLHSGAEYEVIIMVEANNGSAQIFDNDASYQQVLKTAVPKEFMNNTILFNRKLLETWYPQTGQHEYVSIPLLIPNTDFLSGPKHYPRAIWPSLCSSSRSCDLKSNTFGKSTWTFDTRVTTITILKRYQSGQNSSQGNIFGNVPRDTTSPTFTAIGRISWRSLPIILL